MTRKCAFCDRTSGLFKLEIEPEFEGAPPTIRYCCGPHWDSIVAIARLGMQQRIDELEKRIEDIDIVLRRNLPA